MKKYFIQITFLTVFIVGANQILYSQPIYKINNSKNNTMQLSGTSTLHDWTMFSPTFTGEAQFDFTTGSDIHLVYFSL